MRHEDRLHKPGLLGPIKPAKRGPLSERFLVAPFSVWNTREGFWQQRKRAWIRLGIQSELGRFAAAYNQDNINDLAGKMAAQRKGTKCQNYNTIGMKKHGGALARDYDKSGPIGAGIVFNDGTVYKPKTEGVLATGTSIFDPVICEICYRWFCPPAGVIIDPFAGGSVRGIVASVMGYKYWGCDLRAEQIAANKSQINENTRGAYAPKWVAGDSAVMVPDHAPAADFLFSCPPYGSLEVYSDDPADISNKDLRGFKAGYQEIIGHAVAKLKPNRFAVFVVGSYRDKDGSMIDLAGITTRCFAAAGMRLWNEIILVNAVGSGAMRGNGNFIRGGRKVVKMHQDILVYVKGDAKAATADIGGNEV